MGKMPTTLVRRSISAFNRSRGLAEQVATPHEMATPHETAGG